MVCKQFSHYYKHGIYYGWCVVENKRGQSGAEEGGDELWK